MRTTGSIRVALRLAILAATTTATTWRLRARRRLGAPSTARELAIGHGWARRSARWLGVRFEVRGAPPEGRVLVVANHRSYLDIVALLAQAPCAFLAKAEIAEWPLFGAAAKLQGAVFVQREDRASRKAARAGALAALERGQPFAAFPEGTTFRGPGRLPFFPGLFEVAAQHDVPVVPVSIEYADPEDAWVDEDPFLRHFLACFRKRRVRVHVHFGPRLEARCPKALRADAEAWIDASLARALPALRPDGVSPGATPASSAKPAAAPARAPAAVPA